LSQIKGLAARCRTVRRVSSPKLRTLAKAAQTLGGDQPLADVLGVDAALLGTWLQGVAEVPDAAYFIALEIVAKGPFNGRRAR
jgi:hypothetical protein